MLRVVLPRDPSTVASHRHQSPGARGACKLPRLEVHVAVAIKPVSLLSALAASPLIGGPLAAASRLSSECLSMQRTSACRKQLRDI